MKNDFNFVKKKLYRSCISRTRLKEKIENNLRRCVFHLMFFAADTSELFYMAHLTKVERFLYHSNFPFKISNLNLHVNSPA